LFTYLLAGNAVIVSATPAQKLFYDEYPQIGWCYSTGDIDALVKIIEAAYNDPAYLNSRRQYCWQLANTTLNWENEKEKFLSQVKKAV
jgi:glycosyltransferase involved in cell wall biosynthesis